MENKVRNGKYGLKTMAVIIISAVFILASYRYAKSYMAWVSLAEVYVCLATMGLCTGAVALLFSASHKNGSSSYKKRAIVAICFAVLPIVASLAITVIVNTIIGGGLLNALAINISSAVTTIIFAVMLVLCLSSFGKKVKGKVARGIVGAVLIVCIMSGFVINVKKDAIYKKLFFTEDIDFETIGSADLIVTEEEKILCKNWYESNILYAGTNGNLPAYNFNFGSRTLHSTINDWEFSVGEESAVGAFYRGGKTTEVYAVCQKYSLELKVIATIYEENATCEWTVYLKNIGETNSSKVHDFCAINTTFATGDAELYCSQGSETSAEDFTLRKAKMLDLTLTFGGTAGRPTDEDLPYFNIYGKNFSFDLAVGWLGNWQAEITQVFGDVQVKAFQATLEAELLPKEEVRSPLVSLTFYKTKNPLKGFNSFRNWVKDCLYSENLPEYDTVCDLINCSPTLTEEEIMASIDAIPTENFDLIHSFWIDAGWYCSGDGTIWDDRFGYWDTDSNRWPNGVKAYSDAGKELDVGLVLWYEPERQLIDSESELMTEAKKHSDWLLEGDKKGYVVWNYANKDAAEYISAYISNSLKENGVSVFRQDSNFEPESYWEYADSQYYGGRDGICENHYVTNHYAFLDYLFEDNSNLKLYDICASGGTRLELEMIHRGVPLWRSDYNCFPEYEDLIEATQSQTYGISFWLPYTGTAAYTASEYTLRSSIYQHIILSTSEVKDTELMQEVAQYQDIRASMNKNYFPIAFAHHDDYAGILAMQYGDEESGYVLIYKRKDVDESEFNFKFGLLDGETEYTYFDFDAPDVTHTASGKDLMESPTCVSLPHGEKVVIIEYHK